MLKNIILSAIVILFSVTTSLFAATINVPTDTSTIQAAINIASDGDTILVDEGTYYENLVIHQLNIFLIGDFYNGGTSIIDADSSGRAIWVDSVDYFYLEGFTIRNGEISDGYGGGALYMYRCDTVVVLHNRFLYNQASYDGGAICNHFGGRPRIAQGLD